jgi:hypothetical protein
MSETIDTRVSPSLHPANVRQLDGFDDETAVYLAPVETALSEAYEGLGQVHTARDAARKNPAWNEAAQVLQTQDYADKVFARVARHFDSASAGLSKSIAALEEQLSAPITSKASHAVSAEIRTHVRSLKTNERMAFIQRAANEGDETTCAAVFGAPAYLSGVEPNTVEVLTRTYHERKSPAVAKRVRAMKAAHDLLSDRGGLLHKELEKAVGMNPVRVRALRQARTEAEQALILRDA